MRLRARAVAVAAVSVAALALPVAAFAHAALVRTVPEASRTLNVPPQQLTLVYTEPVDTRFSIVSVTDVSGAQVTADRPRHGPESNTLVTPLRRLPQGWYLVFWRVISADGHPVRGAFTFAVGPNPGPAPEFVIPKLSETATTPRLLIARWIVYISLLAAVGLFVLRAGIARALSSEVPGVSLRPLTIAFFAALGVLLVAIPVYVDLATAQFALRSVFDLGDIVPLARASHFGRALIDLELVTALFGVAATISIALDRPRIRARRTVAQLLALWGALGCGAALLLVPGLAGHPSTTSPRGFSLLFDWLHLAAGSIWIGGLIGLLVLVLRVPAALRTASLGRVVPRFSRVAFASVMVLVASGVGASLLQFPTLGSVLHTDYGQALDLKLILLACALLLAGVNLARTKPRLQAALAQPALGPASARLLSRLVAGEVALVVGALFAAALLTSFEPPPEALAKAGGASAKVGPGPVDRIVQKEGYRLRFRIQPNKAAVPNTFAVGISRDGRPLRGADVTATFSMLDMEMGQLAYRLTERRPGYFERSAPALVMVGHWGLSFDVRPSDAPPFSVLLLDRASG